MRRSKVTILNGMKRAEKSRSVRFTNNKNEIISVDCNTLDHYCNNKNYYSLETIAEECALLIEGLNFYNWEHDYVIVNDLSGCEVERDVNIHMLLKPFILPRSVRIEPSSLDANDLIDRTGYDESVKQLASTGCIEKKGNKDQDLIKEEYSNRIVYFNEDLSIPVVNEKALIALNTILNKVFYDDSSNTSNLVSWNSLRQNVSLSSVIDIISIGDKCKYSDTGFIDVELVEEVGCIFNNSWFNSSVDENVTKLEYFYNIK